MTQSDQQNLHKYQAEDNTRLILGWREWVSLPEVGIPAIKVKVDTGAKTSALHAFDVERFQRNKQDFVRFSMHPLQKITDLVVECEARLVDERLVSDSGGHSEMRFVIETDLEICQHRWRVELTLTNRDSMRFRMLLGRRAMENRAIVDPYASYLCGKLKPKDLYKSNNQETP